VAATKTFVSSAVAGLALMAHTTADEGLLAAIARLPEHFQAAIDCDWMEVAEALEEERSLFILGRGPSFALASEAALKFKETCGMHAEAYSAAEVMHGPLALVGPGFPVLALAARDAAESSVAETADALAGQGAAVFATSKRVGQARSLPFVSTGHPLTDPLPLIVSFYAFVEAFARHRGLDPDKPRNLRKVTETK
jgi:glucosamine--fructose-6-phosphate aminotransferase (isomerizing)